MEWQITDILAPTDFSALSLDSQRIARELARRFDARIHLLTVLEPIILPGEAGMTPISSTAFDEERRDSALERLGRIAASDEYRGLPVETCVGSGRASGVITSYAGEKGIDLIVIATHGRTGFEHLIFGSTAERVLREAPCPVLTVRPPR